MQKYRADTFVKNEDGSISWFAQWMGGPSLARINNCRINGSEARRAVYITAEADSYFSIPAACKVRGKYVKGYVTSDDSGNIFHAMDSHKHLL